MTPRPTIRVSSWAKHCSTKRSPGNNVYSSILTSVRTSGGMFEDQHGMFGKGGAGSKPAFQNKVWDKETEEPLNLNKGHD